MGGQTKPRILFFVWVLRSLRYLIGCCNIRGKIGRFGYGNCGANSFEMSVILLGSVVGGWSVGRWRAEVGLSYYGRWKRVFFGSSGHCQKMSVN